MMSFEVEFVDVQRQRKFSYTGVRKIINKSLGIGGVVYIMGIDPVTNEIYIVTVIASEFDYFTVKKEDKENE